MHKRVLAITSLLLVTLSLSAIDLDDATTIIEEASKATKGLQNQFDALSEDKVIIEKKEVPTIRKVSPEEVIEVTEINETIKKVLNVKEENQTVTLKQTSLNIPISTETQTKPIPELNATQTIVNDNNASEEDSNEIEGSVTKGLVIFKTRLKGLCDMNGEEFAKNYTQEDWDDIYDSKEFKKVVIELCPKMKDRYQDRWTPHLYQFSLKYASDSDEIPEC